MRPVTASHALALALVLATPPARASEPDPAAALLAGAGTELAGLAVGSVLVATGHGHDEAINAGWLTIEGGFALAPIAAHATASEWGRGALFALAPAAAAGGTAVLFGYEPQTVEHGSLPQQRFMWACFVVGILGSGAGIVDAILARSRLTVAPTLGRGDAGVAIGGTL